MSEIRAVDLDDSPEPWLMLAIARAVATAELWQDALDAEDVQSEIRLEDAVLTGRSSATTYANSPGADQLFSYGVWVPAADRERAAAVLIDAGWDGRYGQTTPTIPMGLALRGGLVAIAVAIVVVILQVLRG